MRSLAELSALFVSLRGAVVDRAGKPRPGIAPELVSRALNLAERFRAWADGAAPGFHDKPSVFRDSEYARWERDYMAIRAELGSAGAQLQEVDPSDATGLFPNFANTVFKVALAVAVPIGLLLLLQNKR